MSAAENTAVFLSYASQDAEAAQRICEALRAADVEVWFDQSELVGGDAWDQKIRRQIKDCALFVPIISASTQARTEGYFRLEWRLADQRTHLMAKGRPFLLPVVIDDTRDADAHVPDSFTEVQWTRLPGGETPPAFAAHVRRLLGGSAVLRPASALADSGRPSGPAVSRRSRPWLGPAIAGLTAVVALAVWQPWKKSAAPLTEARKLTLQARALIDDDLLAVRENYRLAEELGQRATKLDPADGEAWATLGRVSTAMFRQNYDSSPQRREAARSQAERAIRLAPDSIEAGLAITANLALDGVTPEVEQRYRALLARAPTDWRLALNLAAGLERLGRNEEATEIRLKHPAFAANNPRPLVAEAFALRNRGRGVEAEALVDRAQAIAPSLGGYHLKVLLANGWADLEASKRAIEAVPPQLLLEDVFVSLAVHVWIYAGEGAKAGELLRRVPRDFLEEALQFVPKGFLTGWVMQIAGRPTAAVAEWKQALAVIEKRLATEPNRREFLRYKALLLALTGQKSEAQTAWNLYVEFAALPSSKTPGRRARGASGRGMVQDEEFLLALGQREEVLQGLTERRAAIPPRTKAFELRYAPWYASIRAEPLVQAMIAEGVAEIAARRQEATKSAANPTEAPPKADDISTPADKSVAVLAFADLSANKDSEYFSDGISEELLNVLAKVPGLKVSARTSAFFFKGKNLPIPEIAQKLGVAYVVEGSVRKAGDRVRITAQLIKADDGFHVWSENFDRELKDIFAVQDEIAGLIAKNLSLKLGTATASAPVNPEAFRLYLEGRQVWGNRSEESQARAEQLFTQAIALDPKFARSHAGLADVWMIRADRKRRHGLDANQERTLAIASLDRALQLEPDLAEAHATRGNLYAGEKKEFEAAQAFQRALALNPNYASAHQWYGRLLFDSESFDAGLAELELATRLDPLSPIIASNYGMYLNFARRWAESLAACDRALAVRPTGDQAFYFRIKALLGLGRQAEALSAFRARNGVPGGDQPELVAEPLIQALVLALAGDRKTAEELIAPYLATANEADAQRRVFVVLLALGRRDDAFAYAQRGNLRFAKSITMLMETAYDPVREDPRFLRLVEEAGLGEKYRGAWAQYLAWKKKTGQP